MFRYFLEVQIKYVHSLNCYYTCLYHRHAQTHLAVHVEVPRTAPAYTVMADHQLAEQVRSASLHRSVWFRFHWTTIHTTNFQVVAIVLGKGFQHMFLRVVLHTLVFSKIHSRKITLFPKLPFPLPKHIHSVCSRP